MNDEQNRAGTHLTCTNEECGCEVEIVTPCPHGSAYTCACGHAFEPLPA